jgi:hypothetical protein
MEYLVALTAHDVSEMCKKMTEDAIEVVGQNADAEVMALQIIGLTHEEVQAVAEYVTECVQHHLFDHSVSEGGGMSPHEFLEHTLGVAIPTLLMVARGVYNTSKPEDKYMATVSAELRLQTLIEEKTDLSDVWPAEFVKEITQVFDEPNMAFLAGVICGSSHG